MAIITKDSRTKRAYDFSLKNLYLGVGQTSAWTDEEFPDPPDELQSTITELSFIAKITNTEFVIPGGSDISFRGTDWTIVPLANIYTQNVVNLYINCVIDYDNFPIISYRQVGVLENPYESGGDVCDQPSYLAAELLNQGILHYLDNRLVTNRDIDQKESISIILEF